MTDKTIETLKALRDAGEEAPSMSELEAAQADAIMKGNISVTDKGRELATTEHLAATMKLIALAARLNIKLRNDEIKSAEIQKLIKGRVIEIEEQTNETE